MTTVVGLFKDSHEADNAVKVLKSYGFSSAQISLEPYQPVSAVSDSELKMAKKDEITTAIWVGAVTGATFGLLAGIFGSAQIVTDLSLVGVVLTPGNITTLLISIAASTGICSVVFSLLLTGLIKLGFYAQKARDAGLLISVQTPEEGASEVKNILHKFDMVDMSSS